MKMFAVIDKDHPEIGSMTSYYRTLDEAEVSISNRGKFTAGQPDVEIPGSEFLEIREVERDSHPCVVCGEEVTAKDPEKYPYCRMCHYTGQASEKQNEAALAWFRAEFPDAEVGIDHTGGGCFWLAFYWKDDHFFYTATENAGIPDSMDDGWEVLCRNYADGADNEAEWEHPDYYGTIVIEAVRDEDGGVLVGLTKEALVQAIRDDRDSRALDQERMVTP